MVGVVDDLFIVCLFSLFVSEVGKDCIWWLQLHRRWMGSPRRWEDSELEGLVLSQLQELKAVMATGNLTSVKIFSFFI
jgi:hypothetical protein